VIKASEILGRPAVVREGGQKSGKVKDLVIDPSGRQVLGFVVAESVFRKTKVAAWAGLQTIGEDNVVFNTSDSVVKAVDAPDIKSVLDSKLKFKGRKLQTTAGKDLGEIDDVQFDEGTGMVLGYELSGGIFSGHHFLPTPAGMEVGKDIVFVAPEVEATIQKGKGQKFQEQPDK
jgi:uncharacterized protein YrrD